MSTVLVEDLQILKGMYRLDSTRIWAAKASEMAGKNVKVEESGVTTTDL